MSEEIVRRLRSRHNESINYLKESMLRESPEEDADSEEELDKEADGDIDAPEDPPGAEEDADSEEDSPPDFSHLDSDTPKNNINPLDNLYAVQFGLGDEVSLMYADGNASELSGIIDGYDKEGFYRVKWSNGLTTNGITDISLSELIKGTSEDKCVCGSTEFVNEGKNIVCDNCGRKLRESISDTMTVADKSRPKDKKLVRSEANPVSTVIKPSISEAIKDAFRRKDIDEAEEIDDEEDDEEYTDDSFPKEFRRLLQLKGQFWTKSEEIIEDIEELGFIVDDYNDEYIIITSTDENHEDESTLQIYLGGTMRTKTLDFNRIRIV